MLEIGGSEVLNESLVCGVSRLLVKRCWDHGQGQVRKVN